MLSNFCPINSEPIILPSFMIKLPFALAGKIICATPVIKNGLIYTVTTKNNLMCINAVNGEEVWTTHLRSAFNASPIYLNGNVWLFSVKGEVMTIKAGKKYEVVAENQMDSGIWATPAFLRNSVILRTEKLLYRIGK